MATVKQRVNKGVTFVAANYGTDWFQHVDTDKLDMANGMKCLLAQLEQNRTGNPQKAYPHARERLGLSFSAGQEFGFDVSATSDTDAFAVLTDEWKMRIANLRKTYADEQRVINALSVETDREPWVHLFVTVKGEDKPLTFDTVSGIRYRDGMLTFEDQKENLYTVPNALHWYNTNAE